MKFGLELLETLGYHMAETKVSISPGLESVPGCDRRTNKITIANTLSCVKISREKGVAIL